jgi:hypothetical protein
MLDDTDTPQRAAERARAALELIERADAALNRAKPNGAIAWSSR